MSFARAQLVRLLKIHNEIKSGRYPNQERLADICAVSTRTIRRDIDMLITDLKAPCAYNAQYRGYIYTKFYTLTPPDFTEQELMALSITLEIADSFHNTPYTTALEKAIAKVRLMHPSRTNTGNAASRISRVSDPMPPEENNAIIHFNLLIDAIAKSQQVRITYFTMKTGKLSTRVVDPYHLYFSYGMWYLYAYCHTRNSPREFAVNRIKKMEILSSSFIPPDTNNLRSSLATRFSNEEPISDEEPVEVKIHFTPEGAKWINERIWHPTQQITTKQDGSIILSMKATGLTGIRRWLLGFAGRHATPLSPPALVKQVKDEIMAIAKNLERMNLI